MQRGLSHPESTHRPFAEATGPAAVAPDDVPGPQNVAGLLNLLGVEAASRQEQESAVSEWLYRNAPSERLSRQLANSPEFASAYAAVCLDLERRRTES